MLTLAASLFLIGGAVACDNQSSSVGSLPESSASSIADSVVESTNTAGLDEAYDYLYQLYKDEAGAKTTSFKVVAQIEVGETLYPVTWKVNIKEGGIAEAVKVGATEGGFTTIEVTYNETVSTANTEFDLVATISDGTNEKTATFTGFNVPAFAYGTIAQWLNAKDTETPMAIQGVVTAVNKLDKAGSFTLTDATGSVFSYDSPSAQVNLGDEIVITVVATGYELKAQSNGYEELAETIYRNMSDDNIVYDGLMGLRPDDDDEEDYYDEEDSSISRASEIFDIRGNKKEEKKRLKLEARIRKQEEKEMKKQEMEFGKNSTATNNNLPDWLKMKK